MALAQRLLCSQRNPHACRAVEPSGCHRARAQRRTAPASTGQAYSRQPGWRLAALPDGDDVAPPLLAKLSMPVYSLSTCGDEDSADPKPTMNLVTYSAPVSISPRRIALGLYLGTLSHSNFQQTRRGVLQVLHQRHAKLFAVLGKTSGRDQDKLQIISDAGFEIELRGGLPVLSDAACMMDIQAVGDFIPCGDHEVVICDIVDYVNSGTSSEEVLYTKQLREQGYMQ